MYIRVFLSLGILAACRFDYVAEVEQLASFKNIFSVCLSTGLSASYRFDYDIFLFC